MVVGAGRGRGRHPRRHGHGAGPSRAKYRRTSLSGAPRAVPRCDAWLTAEPLIDVVEHWAALVLRRSRRIHSAMAALHMHRALNALDALGWTQSPRLDRGADANALARHAAIPRPAISFDYLGRQGSALPVGFRLARESAGIDRSPTTRRSRMSFKSSLASLIAFYHRNGAIDSLHRRETMDALATRFHQHLDDLYAAFDGQSRK